MVRSHNSISATAIRFASVPWTFFVAAFLYYVVVTLTAIGGGDLSDGFVAVAYGLPVVAYGIVLVSRAVTGLAHLAAHATSGARISIPSARVVAHLAE